MEAKDVFILQLFPRFATEAEGESFDHLLQTARLVVRPDTCQKRRETRGLTSSAVELWLEGQAKGRDTVALFLWPTQSRAADIVSWLEAMNNRAPEIRRARKVLMVANSLWPFVADGFGADTKEPMFQVDCRWINWDTRMSEPQQLLMIRQGEIYGLNHADVLALHLGTRAAGEIRRPYRRLDTGVFPRVGRDDETAPQLLDPQPAPPPLKPPG